MRPHRSSSIRVERKPRPLQLRLSPGDIIICPAFATGLRWNDDPDGVIQVAWKSATYPEHHVATGRATHANDPSRGNASFLVKSVVLVEHTGPDDVAPGEHRWSRDVVCVRLGQDDSFARDSETIRFSLNEPMSVASPDETKVLVVGYARLPITWKE